MEYTGDQKTAIKAIIGWLATDTRVFRLAGLSGTGKTFVLSQVYDLLDRPKDIVFIAPTGRAAANLSMRGVPAVTMHAFIYDLDMTSRDKLRFDLKEELSKETRVIIVDEASMITLEAYNDLLSFGTKVLFCGDPGQLPPIGKDAQSLRNPDILMRDIVRQAKDNPIVMLANTVYNGGTIKQGSYGGKAFVGSREKIGLKSYIGADQVIVATNKERVRINQEVREHFKRYDPLPMPGDKLVCTRNLWSTHVDGVPIINGMLGYCEAIKMRSIDTALVKFRPEFTDKSVVLEMDCLPFIGRKRREINDLAQFDFGYAITLHKAQGSEWNKVLVIRDSILPKISEKAWLYTAMTRAKQKLVLGV